jgi:hypothetical protein
MQGNTATYERAEGHLQNTYKDCVVFLFPSSLPTEIDERDTVYKLYQRLYHQPMQEE